MTKVACPKCDGKGKIAAFAGIANGDCFMCKATGQIEVGTKKQISRLNDYTKKSCDWIMRASDKDFAKLTWAQLNTARDFAHAGWGVQEAYPNIRSHWFEHGEQFFQAKQDEMLAKV